METLLWVVAVCAAPYLAGKAVDVWCATGSRGRAARELKDLETWEQELLDAARHSD